MLVTLRGQRLNVHGKLLTHVSAENLSTLQVLDRGGKRHIKQFWLQNFKIYMFNDIFGVINLSS